MYIWSSDRVGGAVTSVIRVIIGVTLEIIFIINCTKFIDKVLGVVIKSLGHQYQVHRSTRTSLYLRVSVHWILPR